MRTCPPMGYAVSAYSCWQCDHWETHNQLTTEVTKCSGKCAWPRKASKESRRTTRLIAMKMQGKLEEGENEDTIKARRQERAKKMQAAKKLGGEDKGKFALEFLTKNPDRFALRAALMEKFAGISDAYMSTLYYTARRQIKGYEESSASSTRIVTEASKAQSKKVPKGMSVPLATKLLAAVDAIRAGKSKSEVMDLLATKYGMGTVYAQTVYYQARKKSTEGSKK